MLISLLGSSNPIQALLSILLSLPVLMLALSLHETAHGFVAWKCGDNTAYNLGRLSINPIKHLDPIGFICMMIFGFGWAKPVPINVRNFRNKKRGMALSAAAGPAANLLLGCISAVLYGFFVALLNFLAFKSDNTFLLTFVNVISEVCYISTQINFVFMVFNLIPVPPFDGSRLALVFLPERIYFGIMRYERQIMAGLLIALLILDAFHLSPFSWIANYLTNKIALPSFNLFWGLFKNALLH